MVYAFMIRWSLCAKSEGADEYLIALGNGCLEGVIALLRWTPEFGARSCNAQLQRRCPELRRVMMTVLLRLPRHPDADHPLLRRVCHDDVLNQFFNF